MKLRWRQAGILVLALAGPAAAQERVAVRAGWLVDVDAGLVRPDRMILIRDGRVEAVGLGSTRPPAGVRLIDLSGYTVLPGLIDVHTHLIGAIQSADPLAPLKRTADDDAAIGLRNARITLLAGFTTVRDVGTYRAFLDVKLRDAIEAGVVPGPRMSVAGAYLTVPGGGGEVTGDTAVSIPVEMRVGVARDAVEVRERVRAILAGGAEFIKVIATGAVLTVGTEPGRAEFTEAEIRAAVLEATARGSYVTAHAHGAAGIKNAVRAGVRAIEHGSLIDDEGIALMKARATWLVADIYNGDYIAQEGRLQHWPEESLRKNEETIEAQRTGFKKAVAAGVRLAYGTDAGVYPHGQNAMQLTYMVRYGMTPMQAIQSATIEAARLMRWDDRVGSVRAGRFADLIAIRGEEWTDMTRYRNVVLVMKGGTIVKDER